MALDGFDNPSKKRAGNSRSFNARVRQIEGFGKELFSVG